MTKTVRITSEYVEYGWTTWNTVNKLNTYKFHMFIHCTLEATYSLVIRIICCRPGVFTMYSTRVGLGQYCSAYGLATEYPDLTGRFRVSEGRPDTTLCTGRPFSNNWYNFSGRPKVSDVHSGARSLPFWGGANRNEMKIMGNLASCRGMQSTLL